MSSNSPDFQAENHLEHALIEAQAGVLSVGEFLETLVSSQVFVLLNKEIDSNGWDNSVSPMILSNQKSVPVLVMFTSPERSDGWPAKFPNFSFGLLTEFRWLLQGVAPGVGIVINPGLLVGLELAPARVAELREVTLSTTKTN